MNTGLTKPNLMPRADERYFASLWARMVALKYQTEIEKRKEI
jgi:hypothetical protein